MNTRIISFAGLSVAVHFKDSNIMEMVDYLFQDLNEKAEVSPHVSFSIESDLHSGDLKLNRDDETIYSGQSISELASMLMDQCLFHLVAPNKAGVLIHCAVLARNGTGIMLPGTSGAGKSTLSAWLTRQGYTYLTDELAFIPAGSERIQSFTRPFNIKTRALPVIRDNLQIDVASDTLLANERATLIPHRQLNPEYQYSSPKLKKILFPRFQHNTEFQLSPLSPALAGLDLMKCLINARNLEGDGFPEIARLVRKIPSYSMVYGGFEHLGDELFDILQ